MPEGFKRLAEGWRNRSAVMQSCSLERCAREIGYFWKSDRARGTIQVVALLLMVPGLWLAVSVLFQARGPALLQPWLDLLNAHHFAGPLISVLLGLLTLRLEYLLLKALVRAILRAVLFPIQLPVELVRELKAAWAFFLRCQAELQAWLDGPAIRKVYRHTTETAGLPRWKYPIGQDTFLQNVLNCLDADFNDVLPAFALQELATGRLDPSALSVLYRFLILRNDHFDTLLPGLMAQGLFSDAAQLAVLSKTLAELDALRLARALARLQAEDADGHQRAITRLFKAAQQLDSRAMHAYTAALTEAPRPVLQAALAGLRE